MLKPTARAADRQEPPPTGSALEQLRGWVTDPAEAIRLACVWEATAPKLGNVHPTAAFADCGFDDFCAAAARIAPHLASPTPHLAPPAPSQPDAHPSPAAAHPEAPSLGTRVLAAIQATGEVTSANVNLGIVLLIAPLALAHDRADVAGVLAGLSEHDGAKVFQAIRLAAPGGMQGGEQGAVPSRWDVTAAGPVEGIDLIAAMRSAQGRDRIARQYAGDFVDFFENVVPVVEAELAGGPEIGEGIVRAQLRLLAAEPDSLIQRKCGPEVAEEVRRRAAACFTPQGQVDPGQRAVLDHWLRQDGNRRNPGTTADLIAAAIYWLIR